VNVQGDLAPYIDLSEMRVKMTAGENNIFSTYAYEFPDTYLLD